jgi:antitoxin CptB
MKKQDSEIGILDSGESHRDFHPESGVLDPVYMERVSWRCRRGLLELDIVLGRFIKQYYPVMDHEQRAVFDELLDLPDTELWDLVTGKKDLTHAHQRVVLEWLKAV